LDHIKQSLASHGLTDAAITIITNKIKTKTQLSYNSNWKKFEEYCLINKLNPTEKSTTNLINYLAQQQQNHPSSSLKAYSTAVCQTWNSLYPEENSISDSPILTSFLAGAKNSDPEAPETPLYNLDDLLNVLAAIPLDAPRRELAMKTHALICISTMWRPGIDAAQIRFSLSTFQLYPLSFSFNNPPKVIPDSITLISLNSKNQNKKIKINKFSEQELDPVYHTWKYATDTLSRRNSSSKDRLFISNTAKDDAKFIQPQTLRNWMSELLKRANIKFTPHKIRGLSSTTALIHGASMDAILNAAYWKSESTFSKFYLHCKSLNVKKRKPVAQDVGAITLKRHSKKLKVYKQSNKESSTGSLSEESLRLDESHRDLIEKDDERSEEVEEELLLIPPSSAHPSNVLQCFSKAECNTGDL
jgi:hypothetical protein